ncbi:MAG TPA: AAA family ATPase [Solirubrobacteraceae bacterium]|nr:AAA family ATPase [Solirubrobacteraceae bacterium]
MTTTAFRRIVFGAMLTPLPQFPRMQPGLVSPVFVGRGGELAALVAALESAVAGEPAVVLVGGEAGVGKTRLVEEAAERARARDTRVLTGSCIELGGEGLPLSPVVDALRTLTRLMDPDQLDGFLGPARADLARLLPELDPDAAGSPAAAGESGGARLLELVFGVIQRLSADRPLMLVIEDLQWADRSTLDLVSLLVRGMRAMPVLLVLTFRSDEIHRSHPLRPLIAAWERVRSVRRLELPRFTREEATRQLEAILGSPPPRSMVEPLYERSEGNAFLIEEIVAAMQAGAGAEELPVTLRDVLLARAERLSEPAHRLLRVAAAAGTSVSDRLLAAVAGLDDASLDAALSEAIEHQLLTADDADHGYRFRHALTRDAVYADTMPRERVRTHAAYAEALSADPSLGGSAASAAAALAVHWYAAHNAPRALAASIDAARLAAAYAPAEALLHLERALELWPGVPDAAEQCGIDVVELLTMSAGAAYAAGNLEQSLALYDEALGEIDESAAGERAALLLARKAETLQDLGRTEETRATLERAVSLVPTDRPSVVRAVVLVALAGLPMLAMDQEPAVWQEAAEEALAASRAAGAREQEATARVILGAALSYSRRPEQGIPELRAGLELATSLGDHALALRGYLNLSDTLELVGRHQEAIEEAYRGLEVAARVGLTQHVYGLYLVYNLAESLMAVGRWHEADQVLTDSLDSRLSDAAVRAMLTMRRATLAALAARYDDATRDMEALRSLPADTGAQAEMPVALAHSIVAFGEGNFDRARAHVHDGLHSSADESLAERYRWPLIWFGLRIEAEATEPDADRVAYLRPFAAEPSATQAQPLTYQALAAAELARATGGAPDWVPAIDAARRAGDAYLLAYSLLRGAQQAWSDGDRDGAAAMLDESARLAARMGAAPLLDEAQALARRARLQLAEVGPAGPATERAAQPAIESFGLTDRELEVLQLVAAGRSNPQIASELFISPKTASVHVSNIISKLGVSGRGEAAALAHRVGLEAPAPAGQ